MVFFALLKFLNLKLLMVEERGKSSTVKTISQPILKYLMNFPYCSHLKMGKHGGTGDSFDGQERHLCCHRGQMLPNYTLAER